MRNAETQTLGICSFCESISSFRVPDVVPESGSPPKFPAGTAVLPETARGVEASYRTLDVETHEELVARVRDLHHEEVLHYVLQNADEWVSSNAFFIARNKEKVPEVYIWRDNEATFEAKFVN